jgi:hypothetical protein
MFRVQVGEGNLFQWQMVAEFFAGTDCRQSAPSQDAVVVQGI